MKRKVTHTLTRDSFPTSGSGLLRCLFSFLSFALMRRFILIIQCKITILSTGVYCSLAAVIGSHDVLSTCGVSIPHRPSHPPQQRTRQVQEKVRPVDM